MIFAYLLIKFLGKSYYLIFMTESDRLIFYYYTNQFYREYLL